MTVVWFKLPPSANPFQAVTMNENILNTDPPIKINNRIERVRVELY